jgi:tetraacyldisaccharide 4'-kinase
VTLRTAPAPPLGGPLGLVAAWCYGRVIALRNRRFDRGRGVASVDRPVISVGNLSVGGTGKTPMVMHILSLLREAGFDPCVAMRGYGSPRGRGDLSDEAQEYQRGFANLPIVARPDRARGLAELFAGARGQSVNVVVLDDGFQHRRLARSLDIVLVDATRSPFEDRLLPAGWLREPVSSLARAHVVVITRADGPGAEGLATRIREYAPRAVVAAARHAWRGLRLADPTDSPLSCEWLRGKRVVAACAIGNPSAFLAQAQACIGAEPVAAMVRKDHDPFSAATVNELIRLARETNAEAVLVTEKDWSKLARVEASVWPCPLVRPVLAMEFMENAEAIAGRVLACAGLARGAD